MRWSNGVFAHWDVAPERLAGWVPPWLSLDQRRGRVFIGVVSLVAQGPAPLPWKLVRRLPAYAQVNVRTYVTGPQGPGILLRKTSVGSVLAALGARLVGQPYVPERAHIEKHDSRLEVESAPFSFIGEALAGEPERPGGVERWLLERYVVYARLPGGVPYHTRVKHEPWRVRRMRVDLCETRVSETRGAPPGGVLLAEPVDAEIVTFAPERPPWRAPFDRLRIPRARRRTEA